MYNGKNFTKKIIKTKHNFSYILNLYFFNIEIFDVARAQHTKSIL